MGTERRPLDHQLSAQIGKAEEELVAWWKARFEQIAAIPLPTARAGALVPEWRELMALKEADRITLTRARVLASMRLTQDQQDRVFEARDIARAQLPDVGAADTLFLREKVVPTLPPDVQQRVNSRLDDER